MGGRARVTEFLYKGSKSKFFFGGVGGGKVAGEGG